MKKKFLKTVTGLGMAVTVGFFAVFGAACFDASGGGSAGNDPADPVQPDPPAVSPEEGGYSDLVKNNILNNGFYQRLIASEDTLVRPGNIHYYPHPFGYLQKRGHNIQAIKDGELECNTIVYTVGNDTGHLYVDTRVQTIEGDLDYYTCYSLEYALSEKEYHDLYYFCDKYYSLAPLIVQELSYQKSPQVLAETSLLKTMFESWEKEFNRDEYIYKPFESKSFNFNLLTYDVEHQTIQCKFTSYENNRKIINDDVFRIANFIPTYSNEKVSTMKNAKILNSPKSVGFATIEIWEDYKNNPTAITRFNLQGKSLYTSIRFLESEP